MPPKKLNLRTSVNAINAKAAVGKKKALPKLKVILANPYKHKFETLSDSELSLFKDLISCEIRSSGTSGRVFARDNNIQLGLGSSLRAIGNTKASCVLVSRSIKPKFIIDQISLFAKQKNSTVPVFIVDDWDTISANLFGVSALVVVFPSNMSGKLGKWILNQTLSTNETQIACKEPNTTALPPRDEGNKFNLSSIYLTKPSNGSRSFVPDVVVESKPIPTDELKVWTGDFISFSNPKDGMDVIKMDMDEVDEEFKRKQDKALDSLQRIAKSKQKIDIELGPKTITKSKEDTPKPLIFEKVPSYVNEEWENDLSYISLEVHKIQPNPKRKPKNKRKNKKQTKTP